MTQPAPITPADRLLRAFRSLVASVFPNLLYFATWEFQVQRADGSTFDGSPTEQGLPLPSLVGVPYRGSLAGSTCVPVAGTLAYVTFANGDPSRPILVGFGPCPPASGPSSALPSATRIDATVVTVGDPAAASTKPVARVGDSTDSGSMTALANLTTGVVTFTYTPPGGPTQANPLIFLGGQIVSGSSKLQSE